MPRTRRCGFRENRGQYHGFEAEDQERSIALIQSNSLEVVFQGGLRTLERWIKLLPPATVEGNPSLCLAQAWVYVYSGQMEACQTALEACEEALALSDHDLPDHKIIRGQLLGVRAYSAWFEGDISAAEEAAHESLNILPESDTLGRVWATEVLGAMLRARGDFAEAQPLLEDAISLSIQTGAVHFAIDALWELSVLTFYRGKLDRTMELCQQALDLANQSIREGGRRLPVVGYIYTRMALVLWARGELDRALEHALKHVFDRRSCLRTDHTR